MFSGQIGKSIVVRTHGGLGNQIFQLLYARLLASGSEPWVSHDTNYPHAFELSEAFASSPKPVGSARLISAMRLPKIFERSKLSACGKIKLGSTIFLDGYFQDTHFFEPFDSALIRAEIERLRIELGVDPRRERKAELHHFRLGDFFSSEQAQRDYLYKRLEELPVGAAIITNKEDLVSEAITAVPDRCLSIVPSANATSNETLKLMSEYGTIISNDSTLAFWAACLAGRKLITSSPRLNALHVMFADTSKN